MGVLAYTIGQVDKAITFLENAIKSNPNIAQYWLTYINILIEQNRMDKANRAFEKAVEKGVTRVPFREIKQKLGKLGFSKKSLKSDPYPSEHLTTGILAKRAGVHRDTLLRWLRMGLIPEPKRDRKGWRKFTLDEANAIVLFAGGENTIPLAQKNHPQDKLNW